MVSSVPGSHSFSSVHLLIGAMLALAGTSAFSQKIRLMPLGASITEGFRSSTGDGYRGPLFKQLINEVTSLDFVGSKKNGQMSDPDNEGHGGYRIEQIGDLTSDAVSKYRPNVVTLLVGTNDMGQNYQVATAPDRLGAVIDKILAAGPDATVLVAEIVPSANADTQARTATYNSKIPGVVQARANAGKHVAFVSISSVNVGDLVDDGIHPNDAGYQKIANAWYAGVKKAILNGWIKDPVFVGGSPSNGAHSLRPKIAGGMALDNAGGQNKANNPINIWGINGQSNQSWVFSNTNVAPAGYFNIAASSTSYCMTASSSDNGAAVNLQACNGSSGQSWRPVVSGSGYALSPANNPGLCLDVKGAGTAPGTPVVVWTCKTSTNQQWDIN